VSPPDRYKYVTSIVVATSVVVIDDQRLVREGLAELLASDFDVVGQAANGREGIELCRRVRPDVALVDVVMPVMDGPATTRVLVGDQLVGRVVAITTYDADEHVFAMINAGASGFVLKDIEVVELVAAIRTVAAGNTLLAPSAMRRLVERFSSGRRALPTGPDEPTPRELDVLVRVARGLSNTEIAGALIVSESTIKTHIGKLFDKFQCRDRAQLVIAAYETGVVRPGEK
jgi:DNA-binding NarL/FixJ family response regulator